MGNIKQLDIAEMSKRLCGAEVIAQKLVYSAQLDPKKGAYCYCPVCLPSHGAQADIVLEYQVYQYVIKMDREHGKIGREEKWKCPRCQRLFDGEDFLKFYCKKPQTSPIIKISDVEAWLDGRL